MSARFGLSDLIATGVAAILLLGIGTAARHQAQENTTIVGCADHMRRIAAALVNYQLDQNGEFPRTRADTSKPITAYTQPNAVGPFTDQGPSANDVTSAAFLLARVCNLPADVFVCPAAMRHGLGEIAPFNNEDALKMSNFTARLHYNYSLANMYPDDSAIQQGYSLRNFHGRLPSTFAIAGDTNPGGSEIATATTQMSRKNMRMTNSPNHQRDGQNVLFADGSVKFFESPFVGDHFDSVYASLGTFPNPGNPTDSVLLPVWPMGPDILPQTTRNRRYAVIVISVCTFSVLGFIIWRGMRRPGNLLIAK